MWTYYLETTTFLSSFEIAITNFKKYFSISVGVKVKVDDDALAFLSSNSDSGAREVLNVLENSMTIAAARGQGKHIEKKLDMET